MKRVAKFQEGGMASSGISNEPVGAALRRLFQRRAPMQGPPAPGGGQRPQEDRARMAEEAAPRFDEEERMLMERRRNRGSAITNQPVGERLAGGRPAPAPAPMPQASGRSYSTGEGGTLQPESTQRPMAAPSRPRPAPRPMAREATTAEDLNEIVLRLTRGEKPVTETEKRIADRMGIAYKKGGMVKKYANGGEVDNSDRPEERGPVGLYYNRLLRDRRANKAREKEFEPDLRSEQIVLGAKKAARGPSAGGPERLAREAAEDATRRRNRTAFYQGIERELEGMLDREGARIGQRRDATRVEDNGYKKGGAIKSKAPAKKMKSGGKVAPKKMMKGGMTSKPKKMMGGGRAMYAKGGMAKGCK